MEKELLYQFFNIHLYKNNNSLVISDANPDGIKTSLSLYGTDSGDIISPENIASGSIAGNLEYTGGYIQSANFVSGTSGWKLDSNGTLTAVSATLSGTITATDGTIGGFVIGATTITGGSNLSLSSAGVGTITGGTIQTASSGERIEILSATKRMNFIGASGTVLSIFNNSAASGAIFDMDLAQSSVVDNRGIEISNTATSTGAMLHMTNTGSGLTMDITKSANNSTSVILVVNTTGNGNTISLTTGKGNGIYIDSTPDNADTTNASAVHILVNTAGTGNGIFINDDSDSIGAAIKIDRDSTTGTASITGMSIDVDSAGGGIVVGIDLSGMATGQRVFKFVADATDPTSGGGAATGRIAIDIGGSVKYLAYY